MNYLSLCAIIKNEGLYLREWVEFYLKQGVSRFFLYDNESDDDPRAVLQDFQDVITWHDIKGSAQQRAAYNHCLHTYKDATEFCGFFDIDEFAYCGKLYTLRDAIEKDYDYAAVSGIAIRWLLFGSSGHLEYNPKPVTKRFTTRAAEVNPHCKSIIRLRHARTMGNNVHTFRVEGIVIDENHNTLPVEYALSNFPTAHVLRLNHYVTKSKAECELKMKRGRADTGELHDTEFFEQHDRNDVEDRRIWQVL